MYLAAITIENFRCFGQGANALHLQLKKGLTALVGENDAGKSAVIDALRLALGTTDQEWFRIESDDFNTAATAREVRISCRFAELDVQDTQAFAEYLTYDFDNAGTPALIVNWTAVDSQEVGSKRHGVRPEVRAGKEGKGPVVAQEVRDLLRATYLRPLRDAERALSAGRGSRLSQILLRTPSIKTEGAQFDQTADLKTLDLNTLSVLGIGDLANTLLTKQNAIVGARTTIDDQLASLAINGDSVTSKIAVSGATSSDDLRLRQLLEKIDLALGGEGRLGLGSNNLLFMASELLLLANEKEGNRLLLIEEPEAHLHTQRQLRVMHSLQEQAAKSGMQIIVTTHSPNLASAIDLNNLVIIKGSKAFPLAEGFTELSAADYRFLGRFLDVTKANLFFACGVVIVEGDAENILLPTLAKLIGRDFTKHGVSIVNVGSVGLRRYGAIFQRKDAKPGLLDVPVACVADMDVMPDCAPTIVGHLEEGQEWPKTTKRRWRAKHDFTEQALKDRRAAIVAKPSGQYVKTFVSDEWTLEYDLALGPSDGSGGFTGGFAEDVFVSASLADHEDEPASAKKTTSDVESEALKAFGDLQHECQATNGCSVHEVLACHVHRRFVVDRISKAIAAQYLAERLINQAKEGKITGDEIRSRLPTYLVAAIDYVTGSKSAGPVS